jgi:hypothetical protein
LIKKKDRRKTSEDEDDVERPKMNMEKRDEGNLEDLKREDPNSLEMVPSGAIRENRENEIVQAMEVVDNNSLVGVEKQKRNRDNNNEAGESGNDGDLFLDM